MQTDSDGRRCAGALQSEEALNCPKEKLEELLVEFDDVLSNKPGCRDVVTMDIMTNTEVPICLPPYCIPENLTDKVEVAVRKLLS